MNWRCLLLGHKLVEVVQDEVGFYGAHRRRHHIECQRPGGCGFCGGRWYS